MDDIRQSVALSAAGMSDGETASSLVCPKCRGGNSNDRSFAITKEGGKALFICYRAKCGFRGAVTADGSIVSTKQLSKPPNPYSHACRKVYANGFRILRQTYRQLPSDFIRKCRYSKEQDRYLFPIRGLYGGHTGWVARSFTEKPKTITYWDTRDDVMAHMATYHDTTTVVVVEDIPSAESISNVCKIDAVAMLGSYLHDSLLLALKKLKGYKRIVLAFDEDAWVKSEKFAEKFSLLGVEAIRWESGLDPKDMSREELLKVFGELDETT